MSRSKTFAELFNPPTHAATLAEIAPGAIDPSPFIALENLSKFALRNDVNRRQTCGNRDARCENMLAMALTGLLIHKRRTVAPKAKSEATCIR